MIAKRGCVYFFSNYEDDRLKLARRMCVPVENKYVDTICIYSICSGSCNSIFVYVLFISYYTG